MTLARCLLLLSFLVGCKGEATRRREVYECKRIVGDHHKALELKECLVERYGWRDVDALDVDLGIKKY